MKSLSKILVDIGPLAIFFIFYTRSDLKAAILPFMIATVIAVLFSYIMEKKIPYVPLVGAVLISLFGGLTIVFKNPIFLYLKPTIINIIFVIVLWAGKVIYNKNLLKLLFKNSIKLEEVGWDKLMYRWIIFFIFLAVLNEVVWRTQTEEIWVNFKVWGMLPLTFIFTVFQVPLIQRYKKNEG